MGERKNVEGMKRFGISGGEMLGVPVPKMRKLAKEIGRDHALAQELWKTGVHEARILASMVDEIDKVDARHMDAWIKGFDSWDVCDQCCMNLFSKSRLAYRKCFEWSKRKREFEKRAGFALMACLAWTGKEVKDAEIEKFFPVIKREARDERNFVRKAVNWALRNIGKRNRALNRKALAAAKEIQKMDSKPAKWIAGDAIRELAGKAVQKRLE